MSNEKTILTPGQRAQKIGGSYQATGTIVGAFTTLKGFQRYVFEFDEPAGMLHIFGPEQVEALPEQSPFAPMTVTA